MKVWVCFLVLALVRAGNPADQRYINEAYGQNGLSNIRPSSAPIAFQFNDASGVESGFAQTLSKNSTIPPVQTPDGNIHFFAYTAGELYLYTVNETGIRKTNLKKSCGADAVLSAPAVTPLGNIVVGGASGCSPSGCRSRTNTVIMILIYSKNGNAICFQQPRVHAPFIVGVSAPIGGSGTVTDHQLLSIGFGGTVVYDFHSNSETQIEWMGDVIQATFGTTLSAAIWSASGLQITNDHYLNRTTYLYTFNLPLFNGQQPDQITAVGHFPYPWNIAANTAGEKFMANGTLVKYSPSFDIVWQVPSIMGNVLLSFDDEIVLVSTSSNLEVPGVASSPHNLTAVNTTNGKVLWAIMYTDIKGARTCKPTEGPWTFRTPVAFENNLLLACYDGTSYFITALDLLTGTELNSSNRVTVNKDGNAPNHIWFDLSMNVYCLYNLEGNVTYITRVSMKP